MAYINTLTPIFKDFAECVNNSKECNSDPYIKARIVLSRLYYACFHKGLEDFSNIRNSSEGKKHQRLIEGLTASTKPEHKQLLNLILKLKDLRIWADYDYSDETYKNANPSNLGYYIYQICLVIK
ncbi:hypothetical protein ACOTVZ_02810 [Aliarcobacter butzleri]|uniref:hypothetical protein n=1 Tax=Aliarcobacter butzleri TaxID=28197 RepID=UPI0021B3B38B|nr:hypothetical protein [Aliarcobacter butzleri]MCT7576435.1 hypothetical protein [Aliarcobacter butzleri]